MQLRPYQKECIEILNSLPEGARVVVCLATGLGKTVVGANIDFSGRMLWISHRDELVRQPEKYFKERGFSYGIEKADEHSNGEKVVSASIQTLCKIDRLQSFNPDDFEIIICDEAQHAAASSYRRVLDYFHPKKLIGLTATPKRGDKVRLTDVFDTICYTRDLRWGIENKYLSRIRCLKVQADYDMNTVSKSMGDYTAVSLDEQMSASNDDLVVAKAYIEHCLPTHRQTLIYCPSIRICYTVYYAMMAALPKEERDTVAVLTDKVSPEERAQILKDYSRKKIHCIINCMILTEGTDLPETSCIINNRPSANASLYVQIIGRGTRPADGKDYCLVIDIVGKNYEFKDICTAPTLFGIDPDLLPKKVRKQMEEEDLLEFSNAVLRSKDSVLGTRLIQEMVDIFTQERIAIVTENAREGYRKIAGEYEKKEQEKTGESGYDFGDILVKREPFDNHYFRIDATYNGRIYLSKPDLLDQTVVDIDIPKDDDIEEIHCTSEKMPMKEAIELVDQFLSYCVPDKYRIKWSVSRREHLKDVPLTRKQLGRILNGELFKKLHVNGSDLSSVNGLQASNLIDMTVDYEDMLLRKKEAAALAKDMQKKRSGKNKEKWVNRKKQEEEAHQKEVEVRKAEYDRLLPHWQERFEVLSKNEDEYSKTLIYLPLSVNFTYYSKASLSNPASPQQIEYLKGLHHTLIASGYILDATVKYDKLSSWVASLLIDCWKAVTEKVYLPLRSHRIVLHIADFIDQALEVRFFSPGYTIQLRFHLIPAREKDVEFLPSGDADSVDSEPPSEELLAKKDQTFRIRIDYSHLYGPDEALPPDIDLEQRIAEKTARVTAARDLFDCEIDLEEFALFQAHIIDKYLDAVLIQQSRVRLKDHFRLFHLEEFLKEVRIARFEDKSLIASCGYHLIRLPEETGTEQEEDAEVIAADEDASAKTAEADDNAPPVPGKVEETVEKAESDPDKPEEKKKRRTGKRKKKKEKEVKEEKREKGKDGKASDGSSSLSTPFSEDSPQMRARTRERERRRSRSVRQ